MKKSLNRENEMLKRNYIEYIKNCRGAADGTVNMFTKALNNYLDFTKNANITSITKEKAMEYKDYIENNGSNDRTVVAYLTALQKFFVWLSTQQSANKKQKIINASDYLTASRSIKSAATRPTEKEVPTYEEIYKLFKSIEINNEVDMRDKALIAFLVCTGIRVEALITLTLKTVDLKRELVKQYPCLGVKTKFSKSIDTYLLKFNNEMFNSIVEWIKYLKDVKKFTDDEPLFPRNKLSGFDNFTMIDNKPWANEVSVLAMLERRFKEANVEYCSSHRFRDLVVQLGLTSCENALQIKAISQNFGHENITTTIMQYGTLKPKQLGRVIKQLNYDNINEDYNKWTDVC